MVSIFKKIVSFVSGASVQKKDTPIKIHKLTLAQMNKELEEYKIK